MQPKPDLVNHPPHYTSHPSGIECITITEHMGFNLGNALKYIWRADEKGNALEDLKKAEWYIKREIAKREKSNAGTITVDTFSPEFVASVVSTPKLDAAVVDVHPGIAKPEALCPGCGARRGERHRSECQQARK